MCRKRHFHSSRRIYIFRTPSAACGYLSQINEELHPCLKWKVTQREVGPGRNLSWKAIPMWHERPLLAYTRWGPSKQKAKEAAATAVAQALSGNNPIVQTHIFSLPSSPIPSTNSFCGSSNTLAGLWFSLFSFSSKTNSYNSCDFWEIISWLNRIESVCYASPCPILYVKFIQNVCFFCSSFKSVLCFFWTFAF